MKIKMIMWSKLVFFGTLERKLKKWGVVVRIR